MAFREGLLVRRFWIAAAWAECVLAPAIASAQSHGGLIGGTGGSVISTDIDSEDVYHVPLGLTAGLGLDINVDEVVSTSDVRYVRDVTPMFEDAYDDEELHHEPWLLMVGLMS